MSLITRPSLYGVTTRALSNAQREALASKLVSLPGLHVQLIHEFDIWRPNRGGARVHIYKAGTTELARVYTDIALTEAADNPQILLSRATLVGDEEITYGKFENPLYTPDPYYLDIDNVDQTGVTYPPITSIAGENISTAVVRPEGGSVSRELEEVFAQWIWAEDYGALGDSPTENTTTLGAAIGAAAARGGGWVLVPAGLWLINQITVPARVILAGVGAGATTLRSTVAGQVVTFTGDGAGLRSMTIDGLNVVAGSVGIYSKGNDDVRLEYLTISRFEKGLLLRGGRRARFTALSLDGNTYGGHLAGSLDGSGGDELRDLVWDGGLIESHVTAGVWLEYVDEPVQHNVFRGLVFDGNAGNALHVVGARFTRMAGCSWLDNATAIRIEDDSPANVENEVTNFHLEGGHIKDGNLYIDGAALNVQFEDVELSGTVEITLAPTIDNPVQMIDCTEGAQVSILGDGTRLVRWRQTDTGEVRGTTTDGTATKAQAVVLDPGETALLEMKAIANQVDGEGSAVFHVVRGARRDTSDLDFDGGTIAFNLGETVVGATSGASAYITAKTGTTATGSISLRAISGVFQDNEALQVAGVTKAFANGTLTHHAPALTATSLATLYSDKVAATGSDNLFAAVGNEIQAQVQGVSGRTFEWTVWLQKLSG